jgi:hypothetical protein
MKIRTIFCGTIILTSCLFAETEEIIIRLAKDSDGKYHQITEEEYQKTERKDFSFKLLPTEEMLKQVGDAFGKRIIIYDPFENSKTSGDLKEVSFDDMMELLLQPMGYEYKEFEGGIVVVTLSHTDKSQLTNQSQ